MESLDCERHILAGVWRAVAGCLTSLCVWVVFFGFFSRPLSARVGMRECKSRFKLEPIKMDKKKVGQRRTLCESLLESLIPCH